MNPAIIHLSGAGNRAHPDNHDGQRFILVLDGDVRLEYGEERVDAALEHLREFHEPLERRRELARLHLRKPADGELGAADHSLECQPAGGPDGPNAAAEIGDVERVRHGWA